MAHQNKRHIKDVIKREFNIDVPIDSELCKGCINGKAHRLKFGNRKRAENPGQVIHSDVCGPFVASKSGLKYFVVFKDDWSRFRKVYFMKTKDEVSEKLKDFLKGAKVSGHTIKSLLCDNGGEFNNERVQNILRSYGIEVKYTMPYTPEQNGCAERENRTLVEAARALIHSGKESLPKELWAEMINSAAYILNRTGVSSIAGKSPFELWTGQKPYIKHLRIIGSKCWVHVPKIKRKKFDKKAQEGILLGYDGDNGYRVLSYNKLIRSRDVIFQESTTTPIIEDVQLEKGLNQVTINLPTLEDDSYNNLNEDPVPNQDEGEEDNRKNDVQESDEEVFLGFPDDDDDESETEQDNKAVSWERGKNLREISKLNVPKHLKDYVNIAETDIIPQTYDEAKESKEAEHWSKAMELEMKSLEDNQTWTMCKLPPNRKVIPSKWVYTKKYNADGSLDRYKARLVVKGFAQKKGLDYQETFSPVARGTTIRTVLSVAADENMHLYQFDVSTAFLNGELNEEIYIRLPEGFQDKSNHICRLNKSLYGLKQAPRCWNQKINSFLKNSGFKISSADPCLYVKNNNENKILLVLYVDDWLIAASNKEEAEIIIAKLKTQFRITAKPAEYYLGFEINQSKEGIKISQKAYINRLLQKFQMDDCNAVSTPILKDDSDASRKEMSNKSKCDFPYREAVGSLMYLMTGTRPDISFAVSVVSRKQHNPSEKDICKVKRIFRYLKGVPDLGILYKRGYGKKTLYCYSDADLGGDILTGRSTSGIVCIYSGGVISWFSKRQTSVAISTTDAEVIAASEGTREMVWLRRLLEEITNFNNSILFVDNNAAIKLAENPVWHKRTKHISIRNFFVREKVQEGTIKIRRVATQDQLADGLTKPLHSPRLKKLNEELGLCVC